VPDTPERPVKVIVMTDGSVTLTAFEVALPVLPVVPELPEVAAGFDVALEVASPVAPVLVALD
jgi:hypothetical protein